MRVDLWILRRGPTLAGLRILISARLRKIIPVLNFRVRADSTIQGCGSVFCKLWPIDDKDLAVLAESFAGHVMSGRRSRCLNPDRVNLNATGGDVLRRNPAVDNGVIFEIKIVDDCGVAINLRHLRGRNPVMARVWIAEISRWHKGKEIYSNSEIKAGADNHSVIHNPDT